MKDKLKAMTARFAEVERLLGDPAVLRDPNRLRDLGREHSELKPVVDAYARLEEVETRIGENRELAHDPDPEMAAMAREELPELEARAEELNDELKLLLVPKDPLDGKNIILELRAGTGGEEAALFARELFEMYTRFADNNGWRTEVLSMSEAEKGGIKEIIAQVSGKEVYGKLRYESGVHRVQRVPATEASGRIHTSAVTVAVLPEAEEVDLKIDEADLKIDVFRSQGCGGQSVNTTDSAVRITHKPTGMVVTCQDERSQHKNKSKAMKILRARLLAAERERLDNERAATRKDMVRSGDRSEKIRTYNFPQSRLTDHRIGLTLYKLDRLLAGELDEVVSALAAHHRAQQLTGANDIADKNRL